MSPLQSHRLAKKMWIGWDDGVGWGRGGGGWGNCAHTLARTHSICKYIVRMNVCGIHIHKHGYIRQCEIWNIPMSSRERDYVLSASRD